MVYFIALLVNFHQNILHLDVSMQEPFAMDGLQSTQNIHQYPGGFIQSIHFVGLFRHVDAEISSVAKLNYNIDIFVVFLRVVELNHVVAFYLFHDFDLVVYILSCLRVQFFLADLLYCPLVPFLVSHQVDFAESSPPDFPDYLINS